MPRAILTCLPAVLALFVRVSLSADAKCYYPNGEEAQEKPCSNADGAACCPDKWECLDNGLCYYDANKIWGTYSCTDQSWNSTGCPSNLCTYDMQRVGGESMTQCSDQNNQWCCNADNVHVDCCKESPEPRPFFSLASGKPYATIGTGDLPSDAPNLASITGLASGTQSGGGSTPTPSPSSNGDSSRGSSAVTAEGSTVPEPITSVRTSVSSGSDGVSTQVVTSVITPPASTNNPSSTSSDDNGSNDHIGLIVGCAVGIPLALALAGIIFWMLRKRRHQKNTNPYDSPEPFANDSLGASPAFAGGAKLHKPGATTYKSETNVPELSGQSVGPARPISTIKGRAELESGGGFAPGAPNPYAPNTVGLGGGTGHTPPSSWGSAPPGYSPGMNTQQWNAQAHGMQGPGAPVEADGTAVAAPAPVAAYTAQNPAATEGGRYIPYRPPQHQQQGSYGGVGGGGGTHLSDVPEMSELGSVRTPPPAG
ncbi:hypothetical protein EJ04DRAFT_542841 [Polyplosphaeria fusca]|uniref:Uncharacterized protein n=1 Tax=Polyplosphaeria fusca TaxID=682080 RepID=A0A9P4V410_9PLEO|nr:hypothetical protein EJ04DRAFT_542841 [Polyplosphaeria fusca]